MKSDKPDTEIAGARSFETCDYMKDGEIAGETKLPAEEPVQIWVGSLHLATLHSTPDQLEDLARGFVLGQGFVSSPDAISSVKVHHQAARVEISLADEAEMIQEQLPADKIIYSGCGQPTGITADRKLDTAQSTSPAISTSTLRRSLESVLRQGEVYRQTRGVHSAGLFRHNGEELVFREDIGRHNACDKVLGWLSRQEQPPADVFMATSGRISAEAVSKVVRFGIPVLVSKGVPTSLAVNHARRLGLTLGSSLGPGRLRLYSHRYRVKQ